MNNAVIYARFSSHGQNEQSIEGQVRLCREFAESKGLNVVNTYPEKARTGTNDDRPAFQRMIRDAESGAYQYIIVYMFDRFARNRRDSIMYKEMLKDKYGIKVLSATQPISEDEGGEFYEMFLEWNDEKYSKRLSKRVRGGLDTSVSNGTFGGGYLIYGYKTEPSGITGKKGKPIPRVAIDEEQAALVRYAFKEYGKGVEKKDIAIALNAQGHRYKGKPFTGKTFDKWVVNDKYTGEFMFGGRVCNNMYPAIVDKALFERVQARLRKNKYFAGGTATARVPYLLTGKAACGYCETDMVSDGGTSKTGKQHHYYACKQMKKGKCDKQRNGKDGAEKGVTVTVKDFLRDLKNAEIVVSDTLKYYAGRTCEESLRSVEVKIVKARKEVEELADAFVKAKSVLLQNSIEKKMTDYEALLNDLTAQQAQLEIERGWKVNRKDLLAFIAELLEGDPDDKEYQRKIIDNLVYRVYFYDGYKVVYLNLSGGKGIEGDRITLKDTNTAVEGVIGVQTQFPLARQEGLMRTERYGNKSFFICRSFV
jgi:DNA invertase Pin-like site-specific DNA recombinase